MEFQQEPSMVTSYSLEQAAQVLDLEPGMIIEFGHKGTSIEAIEELVKIFAARITEFDDPKKRPKIYKPDSARLKKRITNGFETGFMFDRAKIIHNGEIYLGIPEDSRSVDGILASLRASIKLPGGLRTEDMIIPFIVAKDGKLLRAGPLSYDTGNIGQFEDPQIKRAIAAYKSGIYAIRGLKSKNTVPSPTKVSDHAIYY